MQPQQPPGYASMHHHHHHSVNMAAQQQQSVHAMHQQPSSYYHQQQQVQQQQQQQQQHSHYQSNVVHPQQSVYGSYHQAAGGMGTNQSQMLPQQTPSIGQPQHMGQLPISSYPPQTASTPVSALYERTVTAAPGGGPPSCSLPKKEDLCVLLSQMLHYVRHLKKNVIGLDKAQNVPQIKHVTDGIRESVQKLQEYFNLLMSGEFIRVRPHFLTLIPLSGLQLCNQSNQDEWMISKSMEEPQIPYWEDYMRYHQWVQGGLKSATSIRKDLSQNMNIRASVRFSSRAATKSLPLAPPLAPFDSSLFASMAQIPEFILLNLRVVSVNGNSGVVQATIMDILTCLMHFSGWRMDHVIIRGTNEKRKQVSLPSSLSLASPFTLSSTAMERRSAANESMPTSSDSAAVDLFTPSEHVTFRQLTQVATSHLLCLYTFEDSNEDASNERLSRSSSEIRLRRFLLWLSSYRNMYKQSCCRCRRLLDSSFLVPLYRGLEDSKECCHIKCRS